MGAHGAPRGALAARPAGGVGRVERARRPRTSGTARASSSSRVYAMAARALVGRAGRRASWSAGPSTTKPRPAWLEGLLRHCRERGCRVSFLSFHANLLPTSRSRRSSTATPRAVRTLVSRATATCRLQPRSRSTSRWARPTSTGPARSSASSHHMEAGGADAAARSCWPDLAGADNCSNGTLEGLLTPSGQPRSAWWAYRAYAEGAERARAGRLGLRRRGGARQPPHRARAAPQVLLGPPRPRRSRRAAARRWS